MSQRRCVGVNALEAAAVVVIPVVPPQRSSAGGGPDRKSTRLNSSHFDNWYLPSFPTRRSSDLNEPAPMCGCQRFGGCGGCGHTGSSSTEVIGRGRTRSEEHTSELQSLRQLVSTLFPYTTLFRSE